MNLATTLFLTTALLLMSTAANLRSTTPSLPGTPVGVGDVAPDFTLADQNGHRTTLSDARGKSPVVLVFYRGYW